jgi:hypothetical protein
METMGSIGHRVFCIVGVVKWDRWRIGDRCRGDSGAGV